MSTAFDVAVVGAGMAGLCAAEALGRAGKSVVLLEARDRCGGRIITLKSDFGSPIELGPEFVHGKPEPTLSLARRAGVELIPIEDRHFRKEGGRFVESKNAFLPFEDTLSQLDPSEPDESARAFVDRHAIDAETRERFRQLVEGFEAAPLNEVSIQSLAADSGAMADDDSQFRVRGGYATLSAFLEKSAIEATVELRLGSRVASIRLEQSAVLLSLENGPTLRARACVIAVPLGDLQSEPDNAGIAFEPPLSALKPQLELLAMGHACRVVLRFATEEGKALVSRIPSQAAFFHEPTLPFETFWVQATAKELLWTAWAGGPKARRLAAETPQQRERLAVVSLANLLDLEPDTLQTALSSIHHHDYSNDPWSRGAYSFIRPGGMNAARELSEPLHGVLFIAGEATDHEFPGTVAGALASGARAAARVLETLAAARRDGAKS